MELNDKMCPKCGNMIVQNTYTGEYFCIACGYIIKS